MAVGEGERCRGGARLPLPPLDPPTEPRLPPLPYTEEEEVGVAPRLLPPLPAPSPGPGPGPSPGLSNARPRCTGGVVERAGRLRDPPPPVPPPALPLRPVDLTPPAPDDVLAKAAAIDIVGVGVGVLELALVCLAVCVCRDIRARSRSSAAMRRCSAPSRSSPPGGRPFTRPDPDPGCPSVNRSPGASPCPDAVASPCPGAPVSAADRRCLSLVVSRAASTLSRSYAAVDAASS